MNMHTTFSTLSKNGGNKKDTNNLDRISYHLLNYFCNSYKWEKKLECLGPVQNGRIMSRYKTFRDYCWEVLSKILS